MSTLLEIKGLYGGYEKGVNILQGIDLTVEQGEAVGIIGLNGSGKSTLGKAIMNLLPYRRGTILFDGQHIEDKTTHELAQMGIAMMHQGGVVFPNLSVWQNLSLAWGYKTDKAYYEQIESIIPLLRKPKKELIHTMADRLSGGEHHELALAVTLSLKPKLVILDEPSAGLSPKAVEEMYEMLGRIKELFGITFLQIEQNVKKITESCGRCVMMEAGMISHQFLENSIDFNKIKSLIFNGQKYYEI